MPEFHLYFCMPPDNGVYYIRLSIDVVDEKCDGVLSKIFMLSLTAKNFVCSNFYILNILTSLNLQWYLSWLTNVGYFVFVYSVA